MTFPPPDLTGWLAFCENCQDDRHVNPHDERDLETGELYYEWTCQECDSTLLTITRANPDERERMPPKAGLS
jgi:hypothetical protein